MRDSYKKHTTAKLPSASPYSHAYTAAFAATLVLALVLRAWNLGAASLWYDEAMYGWLARKFHPGLLTGHFILVEPLFVWPLSWWVRCSDADWWLRLPSVVAGMLTVYAAASTAGKVAGKRAALCTAVVLAVAPVLLYYSRDAKMYAWVFLWLTGVLRGALLYGTPPHRLGHLALYIAAGTALCYTHFAAPLFLAVSGLGFLVCFARTLRVTLRWIFANALIVLLAVPFIIMEVRYQFVMQDYVFHALPPDFYSLYIALAHFFTAYTTSEMLLAAALLFFALILMLGLFWGRGLRAVLMFLILMGLVPLLLLYVLSTLAPWSLFVDRYVMASAVPLLLAASIALTVTQKRVVCTIGLLCCLLLSGLALPDVYRHALPKDLRQRKGLIARPDAPRMAEILRQHARESDIVLHPSWETEPILKWYAPEYQHVLADYQGSMKKALANLAAPAYLAFYGWEPIDVRRAIDSVSRAWVVFPASEETLGGRHGEIREELALRSKLLFSETCGGALFQCYDLSTATTGTAERHKTALIAFPETLGGGTLEFQLDSEQTPLFELAVRNQTKQNVPFRFEAVPCDLALPASALVAGLNADNPWSLGPYLAGGTRRIAAFSRVHPQMRQENLLETCFTMPAGIYGIYLERTREGSTYTVPAAALHIEFQSERTTSFTSIGKDVATGGGWAWERLGYAPIDEHPTRMSITATDPEQRPEAYAVFSQLVLIREEIAPVDASGPPIFQDHIACPSGECVKKPLSFGKHPNSLVVQGTAMDACVALINNRTDTSTVLPSGDCK